MQPSLSTVDAPAPVASAVAPSDGANATAPGPAPPSAPALAPSPSSPATPALAQVGAAAPQVAPSPSLGPGVPASAPGFTVLDQMLAAVTSKPPSGPPPA